MPLKPPPGWKDSPRPASPICTPPIVRNRRRGDPVLDIRISGLDRKANGIDDPLTAMRAELEGKLRAGAGGKDAEDARGALALVNDLDALAAESEPPTR